MRGGLAVIFGMMGVINLAHGEFIMAGAYVTVTGRQAGRAVAAGDPVRRGVRGLVGIVLERLVIRHLYGRPLDTIVATWGISLIASQGTLILLGSSLPGIGTPLGSVQVGDYSYSVYRFVLMATAAGDPGGALRAVQLHPVRRAGAGDDPGAAHGGGARRQYPLIYSLTFGLGAALAGATGGLYAPTMTLVPTMGASSSSRPSSRS